MSNSAALSQYSTLVALNATRWKLSVRSQYIDSADSHRQSESSLRVCQKPLSLRLIPGVLSDGDCGTLVATSPFMMSCIEASKASTRVDIWVILSKICVDISSNLASSCSKSVSTNAVSS